MNNNTGGSYGNTSSRQNSRILVPGARQAIDRMKYEVANELGVNLGADTTSRRNGTVGGYMVRNLITRAEEDLSGGQGAQRGGGMGNTEGSGK